MLENFAQDVAGIRAHIGFVRHDRILSAVTVLRLLTPISRDALGGDPGIRRDTLPSADKSRDRTYVYRPSP